MKKQLNKLSLVNKIALLAITILIFTNPWAVGYIDYAIEIFATYFVEYSVYAFVVSLVMIIGVVVYFMYSTREKVVVPKNKRSKARYIET